MTTILARAVLFILAAALAGAAWAQTPPRPAAPPTAKPAIPPPSAPDPAYEAARAAFEALPEAVRRSVQDALVWTGDYNAVTAGTYGRRTYDGIAAWQKRGRAEPTGILTAPQRTALDAAGAAARNAAGFKVQADAGSGAVLGVPEKVLPRRSTQPGGTRWQSADGRITLDTKSFKPGETALDSLYERVLAQGPDRRITYKVKKPDFIVITGETATGRFYIRYASGEAGIRGFTIGYDKALAAEADRLVIAVANAFVAFPDAPRPAIAAAAASPTQPNASPVTAARPAATGLIVAPGRVLASATVLDTCRDPSVGGKPARMGQRDATGAMVLLDVEAMPPAASAPPVRAESPGIDEPLVVLSAETKGNASVAPGIAAGGGVFAPLQPGASGAVVFDRTGHLVGLVAGFPAAPRLIAGVMPPTRYALVPAGAVAAFLSRNGIEQRRVERATAATLGTVAAPFVAAVVAITCGR